MPRGRIITSDPVNRSHPLNRGRVAWWLTLPHLYGGPTWRDLIGVAHGTIAGAGAGYGFAPSVRRGSAVAVEFDGSSTRVVVPTSPATSPAGAFTIAAWFRTRGVGLANEAMIFSNWYQGDGNYHGPLLNLEPDLSIRFFIGTGTTAYNPVFATGAANNLWHHVAARWDGASVSLFLDGSRAAADVAQAAPPNYHALNAVRIGSVVVGGEIDLFPGGMDDVSLWSRGLSAAEIADLYTESRAGYPRTLNRERARVGVLLTPLVLSGSGSPLSGSASWSPQSPTASGGALVLPAAPHASWAAQAVSVAASALVAASVAVGAWSASSPSVTASAAGSPASASASWAAVSPTAGTPTTPDLVAAALARLRSYSGGSVAAAFGDTTGTPKFWRGDVLGSPGLPWARVEEPVETQRRETPGDDGVLYSYGTGTLALNVFAATMTSARDLRRRAVQALNDAPLIFADGTLLYIRFNNPAAPVVTGPGVGTPTVYQATVLFDYHVERSF